MQPANNTIFRREALESRIRGFSNPVSIRGSLAVHVLLGGIFLVAAVLIIFGMLFDYTRRSVVSGYLHPADGAVMLRALRSGQLRVDVPNGAHVGKGQRIARIVTEDTDGRGHSLVALKVRGLEKAHALARERLELVRKRIDALAVQESAALAQHQRDIEQAHKTVEALRKQLEIVQAEHERDTRLARKGLVAQVRLQERLKQLIAAQQELAQAESRLAMLRSQTGQIRIDWQLKDVELKQAVNRLEQELREIESRISEARSKRDAGIFAPKDGIVTYAAAQDGKSVTVGTPLFQITPTSTELRAVLLAPSAAMGFVKVGDVVQIRYDAFPYREHGVFEGRVISMDETAQPPRIIQAPIEISAPVYRLIVAIDQSPVSKRGKSLRLAPGMTLEASIIIDKKPLLLWLLSPIL